MVHAAEPGISVNPGSYDFGTLSTPNDVVPLSIFVLSSTGTKVLKTRRKVRFDEIGAGKTLVEKIPVKVRRSAKKGQSIRLAGTVSIAGTTITAARRTIRVR